MCSLRLDDWRKLSRIVRCKLEEELERGQKTMSTGTFKCAGVMSPVWIKGKQEETRIFITIAHNYIVLIMCQALC
jgi:hypothetical protein